MDAKASRRVCQTACPALDFGATCAYCPVMFRLGLKVAVWLVAIATAAAGQPAPSSRVGGWLEESIDDWYGPYGQAVVGQIWGRRASEDGIRLIETFELNRELNQAYCRALARFDVVAPLGRVGSFRVGLSPWAGCDLSDLDMKYVTVEPSAGLTLNADDWDFMVAPAEMTYRGPGLKLNVGYSIGDLLDPPSKLSHSVSLDASAPWTLRFGGTRLEVGPKISYVYSQSSAMDDAERRSLGAQVLLAGGSRLVDAFVAPEYYAVDGPGYELSASAHRWTYRASDTLYVTPNYVIVDAQARAAARFWREVYAQPELGLDLRKNDVWPVWSGRLRPRVALVRLWTVRPGCVLAAQVGATLPIGFHGFLVGMYNEEVALDARVGLSGASPSSTR